MKTDKGKTHRIFTKRVTADEIAALGASLTGNIDFGYIPAGHRVTRTFVRVNTAGVGCATLTGSFGQTGASYVDLMAAKDLKGAAGTIYGHAPAALIAGVVDTEGLVLSAVGSDPTLVKIHFIATTNNLSALTAGDFEFGIECVPYWA